MIKTKPSKLLQPKILNTNGKLTANNYVIATEFDTYFNIISEKIDERLIFRTYYYQTKLNKPNQNTMKIYPQQLKMKSNPQLKNWKPIKQQDITAFQPKLPKTTRMNWLSLSVTL